MKNVSELFKTELNNGNRNYVKSCDITLKNGIVLNITNENTWQNGFSIDSSVSSDGTLDLGSAIIDEFSLTLNNIYDDYSVHDFNQAVISNIKVGIKLPDGNKESVKEGIFKVSDARHNGSTIRLVCVDNMHKFDKPYSESQLPYPATLLNIVHDACSVCGVGMAPDIAQFRNCNYVVDNKPLSEGLTYRKVLVWVAQICGLWFKCNENGYLSAKYIDASVANDLYDNMRIDSDKTHYITSFINPEFATDDVVITGIRVLEKTEEDVVTYQEGNNGYVISIEENELIQNGKGASVASYLGMLFNGLRFRPFSVKCLSNPTIEAGDYAFVKSRKGETYFTIITRNTFTPGDYQTIECDAESPERNSAQRFSSETRVYQELRATIKKNKTEFEKAIERLEGSISQTGGAFTTVKTLETGGSIFYLHDKPKLEESLMIWEMTAEAWRVTNDGGKTWNAGMTVDGEVITKILNTVGVNASWINTGALVVKDSEGKAIFTADVSVGKVSISGDSVFIGDMTATEAIADAKNAASNANGFNMILSNEYQSIPVDSNGQYGVFPECSTAVTVLTGLKDVTGECVFSVTRSASVTGSWDNSKKIYSITSLSGDTGWVDITATYSGTLTVTKRFVVSKLYSGRDGTNGVPGNPGKDGKSTYFHVKYSDVPNPISYEQMKETPSKYIGTYVDYSEDDSVDPSDYDWTQFMGDNGTNGLPGRNGNDGKTYYLHIKYSNDNGQTFTGNNGEDPGEYIGVYTDEVEADSLSASSYTWSLIKGEDGMNGEDGRAYVLHASTNVIQEMEAGLLNPSFIGFESYFRKGQSTDRIEYKGIYVIEESLNDADWDIIYESASPESNVRHELYTLLTDASGNVLCDADGVALGIPRRFASVRCTLYTPGKTAVVDTQTISLFKSAQSLTHEEIFNLLTNNGAIKGIYKEGNQLYISFTYARGGELVLGGPNNGNGILRILDESGNQVGYASSSGAEFISGKIGGWTIERDHLSGADGVVLSTGADPKETFTDGTTRIYKDAIYTGDFVAHGTKSRAVNTENYSTVLQYCYEMASPMFGDVGCAVIPDDGVCYIALDPVFLETVKTDMQYYVFLQKEGLGDIYVSEKTMNYFSVTGTPGLAFSWEIKARQIQYETNRLEAMGGLQ